MLELSFGFLGHKSGLEHRSYYVQRTGSNAEMKIYIEIVGGELESYKSYKTLIG
jgi:hypothetical protein